MQLAGTTSQSTTAAPTTTPVQPLGSPSSTVSGGGNVVMVNIESHLYLYLLYILTTLLNKIQNLIQNYS